MNYNYIKIYHDDCLNVLRETKEKKYGLTITSPPYNLNLRIRNGKYISRQIVKELSSKYYSNGNIVFNDNLPIEEYFKFHKKVIKELIRVSDLVFYNIQVVTGNKPAVFKLLGEFAENIKELIIWDKCHAQPAIQFDVMNSQFELIIVLADKNKAISRKFENTNFKRGELSNVWKIKPEKNKKEHKAQFPKELIEKIIHNFYDFKSNKPIFDSFMGTGTVGEICLKNNISFEGCEIIEQYINVAKMKFLQI